MVHKQKKQTQNIYKKKKQLRISVTLGEETHKLTFVEEIKIVGK